MNRLVYYLLSCVSLNYVFLETETKKISYMDGQDEQDGQKKD